MTILRKVEKEKNMWVLKKMRDGKADGMDGIVKDVLKNEGIRMIDWLLRISNRCNESGVVKEDYTRVYGISIQRVR